MNPQPYAWLLMAPCQAALFLGDHKQDFLIRPQSLFSMHRPVCLGLTAAASALVACN